MNLLLCQTLLQSWVFICLSALPVFFFLSKSSPYVAVAAVTARVKEPCLFGGLGGVISLLHLSCQIQSRNVKALALLHILWLQFYRTSTTKGGGVGKSTVVTFCCCSNYITACLLHPCNSKHLFVVWKIKPMYNTLPLLISSQQSPLGVKGGRLVWTGFHQFSWCTLMPEVLLIIKAPPMRQSPSALAWKS